MKVNGWMNKEMVMESKDGQMVQFMKVNGQKIVQMVTEYFTMQTEIYSKE